MQSDFSPILNIQARQIANSLTIGIAGSFRLKLGKNAVPKDALSVLKHIVVVTTRYGNYQSLTPFKDVIVFEDDVQLEGDICSGNFNINLMEHIQFSGEGEYYTHCSIGQVISNTEKVIL